MDAETLQRQVNKVTTLREQLAKEEARLGAMLGFTPVQQTAPAATRPRLANSGRKRRRRADFGGDSVAGRLRAALHTGPCTLQQLNEALKDANPHSVYTGLLRMVRIGEATYDGRTFTATSELRRG